jgi:hypothetical protein
MNHDARPRGGDVAAVGRFCWRSAVRTGTIAAQQDRRIPELISGREVANIQARCKRGANGGHHSESKEDPMTRSRDDDDWDDDDRPRRKSRRARDEDDDDDRPRSTQKKKRKSSGLSPLVWIGAGGGALVLIVGIIVLVVMLIPSQPKITEENIQKIKIGMSQKDVEKIFGSPGKVVSKNQMGGKEAKTVL